MPPSPRLACAVGPYSLIFDTLTEIPRGEDGTQMTTELKSLAWVLCHIKQSKLAIANAFGAWFDIRRRNTGWGAYWPTHMSLHLRDFPVKGLDLDVLACSREAIPTPRCGPTPADKSTYVPRAAVLSDRTRPQTPTPSWHRGRPIHAGRQRQRRSKKIRQYLGVIPIPVTTHGW